MLCIHNPSTEPYFNQAAEEYLLHNFDEDVFMLWQNNNAIIVGKHQNTLAEINLEEVKKKSIRVVRRLTGGGAVFHDMGNLNFTFIMNYGDAQAEIDFKKYTVPIIDVLAKLNIKAEFSGRNDILIDGKKFSGNAEHIYHKKRRVLHHGTLLFASEIADLSAALKVNPLKFEDKAVKSVRSRVTNISSHLKVPISVEEFRDKIMEHIVDIYPDARSYSLDEKDRIQIQNIADNKYSQWDWNFGYSPKYTFKKGIRTQGGHVEVYLNVEKGILMNVKIFGDFFVKRDIEEIERFLTGKTHKPDVILDCLRSVRSSHYFNNISEEELAMCFF
ncbi:MAG: lipoate--protein ligase [Flavobacteriales bacterium]|nr:lipoate--protein ligase [Flavobacteriales bacterium]